MDNKVTSLFGGPTGLPEVNEAVVLALEDYLEKARSGEVIGVAIAALHCDQLGSAMVTGIIDGYSMLGAIDEAHSRVLDVVRDR